LFRSPNRKKEDLLSGERSSSFSTNRDGSQYLLTSPNIDTSSKKNEGLEKYSTKIEITGSFIQEKYDNKRETVIYPKKSLLFSLIKIYEINVSNEENHVSTVIYKSYRDFLKLHKKVQSNFFL